jgi:hypothetical protein
MEKFVGFQFYSKDLLLRMKLMKSIIKEEKYKKQLEI